MHGYRLVTRPSSEYSIVPDTQNHYQLLPGIYSRAEQYVTGTIEQDRLRGGALMFGIESLGPTAQSLALVGIVLVEAIVLYLGYGGLTRVVGPHVRRYVEGR